MRKRKLLKRLRGLARDGGRDLAFVRQGANHEIWSIGCWRFSVPRHREINERTARDILSRAVEVIGRDIGDSGGS